MIDLKKIYSIRFNQIGSTNLWLKEHASSLSPYHLTCITAQQQTAGRGRFERGWISPKGNIYSSLFFTVPRGAPYLSNLSQILSYSAAKALEQKGFVPTIKWPNDLHLSEKKVAGVLTETVELKERLGVVVGIGLNVNMCADALQMIDQPATSLAQESGKSWDVDELMASILEEFRKSLFILETKGFAPFQFEYDKRLAFKGEMIRCQKGGELLEGYCQGIAENGNLNLLLSSGESVSLFSGEIQNLRKKI